MKQTVSKHRKFRGSKYFQKQYFKVYATQTYVFCHTQKHFLNLRQNMSFSKISSFLRL